MAKKTSSPALTELEKQLQVPAELIIQLTPSRNLSTLPKKVVEGDIFEFKRKFINKRYITPEQAEAIEALAETDPIKYLEEHTFIYSAQKAGVTVGFRVAGLLGLRILKKASEFTAVDTASTALTAAKEDGKEAEVYTTLGAEMMKTAAEKGDGAVPRFPLQFRVLVAEEVTLPGIKQIMPDDSLSEEDAKAYPVASYEGFQEEVEQARAAVEARKASAMPNEEVKDFNISDVYQDRAVQQRLRGTKLVNGGVGQEPYKTVYVENLAVGAQ